MNLKYIKETVCSECGAIVVTETQNRPHTNGRSNEERVFECGKTLHYYPNYNNEVISTEKKCPHSKLIIRRDKKRAKLYEEIIKAVEESKADDEYKQNIIGRLRFL